MSPHGAAKLVHNLWFYSDGVFLLGIPSKFTPRRKIN